MFRPAQKRERFPIQRCLISAYSREGEEVEVAGGRPHVTQLTI